MEKTRCSIELGNNRFVQASEWKDEISIDVREWGDQGRKTDTHEKGDQSPPCFLHLDRLVNKPRVTKLGLVYACWTFLIGEHMSWPNMDVTLPFWVIVRSRRRNVMNHIASRGPYLVVEMRGILLPWVILWRERRYDHIWISIFFVTSVPGCRVMPLYGKWAGHTHIRERHRFLGCIKCVSPYY
jgi:hypothetical protein